MKQDIHQVSTIQRYPIGLRYPIDNPLELRRWHYGLAGGTLNTDVAAWFALRQHVAQRALAADVPALSRLVPIVIGADGIASDGNIGEDELAGGYAVIFPHAQNTLNRRILHNTATTAAGQTMLLTLDKPVPFPLTIAAGVGVECMASPYLNVQTGIDEYASKVGVPTMPAVLGEYLWLQTWGPVWIAPQGDTSVGTNNRRVIFLGNGGVAAEDSGIQSRYQQQYAGFVLANAPDNTQGAPFLFLQIAP